jgi:hypothetical protein
LLVTAESIVFLRLIQRERSLDIPKIRRSHLEERFSHGIRKIEFICNDDYFIILLNDRVAEILAGLSFFLRLALNYPSLRTPRTR